MAAQKGRLLLLKIGTGASPSTYTTVGGIRSTTISINNEQVDITTKDEAPWRALLGDAGLRSLSVSGSGVFLDDTAIKEMKDRALDGALEEFQIVFGDGDTVEATMQVATFERAGEHNAEETYTCTLESSGTINWNEA